MSPNCSREHCYLWVEKIGHNSNDAAGLLAERAGVRKRLVSHCGLKDLHALTRQWFSIHLPGQDSPAPGQLEGDGLKILHSTRGLRKLRRGAHDGNRFTIRLRDCEFSPDSAATRLTAPMTPTPAASLVACPSLPPTPPTASASDAARMRARFVCGPCRTFPSFFARFA